MNPEIETLIRDGYTIKKFERYIDKISGEELGMIEMRALDGYIRKINLDDNKADEVEKVLFKYLAKSL